MDVEIERIGETLTPVLDIWSQPEWFQLRSVKRFSISVPLAANVAGIARFQLFNPNTPLGGTPVIVVIDYLSLIEFTGGPTMFSVTDTGAFIAGGLAPLSALDTRYPFNGGGTARPSVTLQTVDNTAAAASGVILDSIEVTTTSATPNKFEASLPFVLTPSNYIQVQSSTVNHQCRFIARGYERTAFAGEL